MFYKNFIEFLNLNLFNSKFIAFCDVAERWQISLQDPATPSMEGMINFHNYIMIFLIAIGVFVLWMLYKVVNNFNATSHPVAEKFTHSTVLEVVWTILPAVILMIIAVPSLDTAVCATETRKFNEKFRPNIVFLHRDQFFDSINPQNISECKKISNKKIIILSKLYNNSKC